MSSLSEWQSAAVGQFMETASRQRAASYRERSAQLAAMASAEMDSGLRQRLIAFAEQYQHLAEAIDRRGVRPLPAHEAAQKWSA